MFSLASGLYSSYLAPTKVCILVIGCDGAGKTALLERCKVTQWTSEHQLVRRKHNTTDPAVFKDDSNKKQTKWAVCPAPKSYKTDQTVRDDDDEVTFIEGEGSVLTKEEIAERYSNGHAREETQHHLKEGKKMLPLHKITPTIGMNLAKLSICGCECVIWDLSGRSQMRSIWERYYNDCDAIIYVVDASNSTKLKESRAVFSEVRRFDGLQNIPMLLFANKMDRKESVGIILNEWNLEKEEEEEENNEVMSLSDVRIQGGSAKTGAGVRDAIESVVMIAKEKKGVR